MQNKKDEENIQISTSVLFDLIIKGQLITQSISIVVNLKIADYLRDGPKSVEELAEKTNSYPDSLYRLLRMLSSIGIFAEVNENEEKRRFKLTPIASLLQSKEKNIIKNFPSLLNIESFMRAMNDLPYTIQTGQNAFKHANELSLYEYLQQNQNDAEVFYDAMTAMTSSQVLSISSIYDFSQFNTIADIGGGQGVLLSTILKNNPKLHGILFDLPHAIESAKENVVDKDTNIVSSPRCKLIAGDFFKTIPPGADAYIIKNVLLNWDDESASTILKNCLQAIEETKREFNHDHKQTMEPRLLIIDMLMPAEDDSSFIGKFVDIMMLALTQNGRIRTGKEFSKLLKSCGFDIIDIIRSPPSSDNALNFLSIIKAVPSSK
jgi:hypothetical protein